MYEYIAYILLYVVYCECCGCCERGRNQTFVKQPQPQPASIERRRNPRIWRRPRGCTKTERGAKRRSRQHLIIRKYTRKIIHMHFMHGIRSGSRSRDFCYVPQFVFNLYKAYRWIFSWFSRGGFPAFGLLSLHYIYETFFRMIFMTAPWCTAQCGY